MNPKGNHLGLWSESVEHGVADSALCNIGNSNSTTLTLTPIDPMTLGVKDDPNILETPGEIPEETLLCTLSLQLGWHIGALQTQLHEYCSIHFVQLYGSVGKVNEKDLALPCLLLCQLLL